MELVATKQFQFVNEKTAPCVVKPGQVFVEEIREAALDLIREGLAYPSGLPEIIECVLDSDIGFGDPEHGSFFAQKGDYIELPRKIYLMLVLRGHAHALSEFVWSPSNPVKQEPPEKFYI